MYQSEEMNDNNVYKLEDFPVEIFSEIFQYLSARELYSSFSQLNIRLNSLLKSFYNLYLVTACHWDPLLLFFDSFRTVQIYFSVFDSSILSQFDFSKFVGVRSFSIFQSIISDEYIEPIEQLEKFICPDRCPYLQSLKIPYCSQTLADWIFTGGFPHLKIFYHYATTNQAIALPSSPIHSLQTIRQLTIQQRTENAFEKILLLCPNLSYLDYSCDNKLSTLAHVNTPYSSLKRLRLSQLQDFLFHDGQFDFLLSLFPSLIQFSLTVIQYRTHSEAMNFLQIGQFLHRRLPRLKALELYIYATRRNRSLFSRYTSTEISQMHPLFKYSNRSGELLRITSFDIISI